MRGGTRAGSDAGPRRAAVPVAPAELDEAGAYALAPDALRAAYHETAARAARAEATAAGVVASRQAARLARVLSRREDAPERLAAARGHLREASRRRGLAGSCEAALELARLEAVEAGDAGAAWLVAHRTVGRFGADAARARCVAEARRTLVSLAAFEPDPAVLRAAEAAPDDEDAPAADALSVVLSAPEDPIAAWIAEQADEAAAGPPPRLERIEVLGAAPGGQAGQSPSARVALYFDRVAIFTRSTLPADGTLPARIVLDFRGAIPTDTVAAASPVGAGGVARVRTARTDPSTLRVTFELDGEPRHRLFFLADPFRVVLDFDAQPPPSIIAATADPASAGPHPLALLMLDPGHGGDDHGARSERGLRESHVVLELAQRVKALLAQRLPETRVLLTRDRDVFVSLEQRAAMANVVGADAFVSIHLNASPTQADRGGVGAFVLDTTADRASLSLAARENGTSEGEVTGLQRILASLYRADQARGSRALAERVHDSTLASGRRAYPALHDRGTQSAMFYVLVGARMPAVLLEASFILRAPEAPLLADDAYKAALAEGIAAGIVRYARGR